MASLYLRPLLVLAVIELTDSDGQFVQILSEAVDNGKLTRTTEGTLQAVDKGR